MKLYKSNISEKKNKKMKKEKNILEQTGNRNPFVVPDGYFENFATNIDNSIFEQPKLTKRIFMPWIYLAAMFVGIFLIGNLIYYVHFQEANDVNEFSDLYEMYVTSQIDQSVMYDYYVSDDLKDLE